MSEEKKVIIYSTSWCPYCKMIKQYLNIKKIEWMEKNIEEDPDAHKELMDKLGGNFRGVPVTDVSGTMLYGFDRPLLEAALRNNKFIS